MKIANKISLAFFAIALVLTIASMSFLYSVTKKSLRDSMFARLAVTAQSRTNHIKTLLGARKESVVQLSQSVVLRNLLYIDKQDASYSERYNDVIRRFQKTKRASESIVRVSVLDPKGKVIASSDRRKTGSDKSSYTCFLRGKGTPYIADAYLSKEGEKVFVISAPVISESKKKLLGVIAVLFSTDMLDKVARENTGLGRTGEIYLVNKYGYFVTSSRFIEDVFLKRKVNTQNVKKAFDDMKMFGDKPHGHVPILYKNYRGDKVLGLHGHIPEMEWTLLAEINEKEAMAPLLRLRIFFSGILLIIPVLAWLSGSIVAKIILKPVYQLHKGTEVIGSGNLDYEIGTQANDEIGQLSRAFDTMTKTLKGTTVSKDYVDSILKSLTDSLIVIDPQGIVRTVNQVTCDLSGYREEELIGEYVSILFPKEEIPLKGTKLERLIKEGMLIDYETDFSTKEGLKIPVLLSGAVMRNKEGD
ncbi:MAG: PAS domain S-box protein, partial [Candidatus Omnitrophica bacterium]|nr:PAS domain S-box protein [Candidatus Omnitrophota bacterium]